MPPPARPEIVMRPIAALVPYARNARTHDKAQIAKIAASMREFGWTSPVLLDGAGGILAGHARVLAAKTLGIDEAPCIELSHLTAAQARAYVLADNRLALDGGWNLDTLKLELTELVDLGIDISLTGFPEIEIDTLLGDPLAGDAWSGMPDFDHTDRTSAFRVIVHFATADDLKRFGDLVGQKLTDKTRAIWYPAAPIDRYADKRYAAR